MVRALGLLKPRHGRARSDWYPWLLGYFRRNLGKREDCIVVIDGDRGKGKSTASGRLCYDMDSVWRDDPYFAAKHFAVFSPREFLIILDVLMNTSDSHKLEFYRGRWMFEDETGAGGSYMATAPVQEKRNVMEIMREWQINYIMNLPVRQRIEQFTYEFATAVVWVKDKSLSEEVVYVKYRVRYRDENRIAFVHPRYWMLLERGVYPPQFASLFVKRPGAFAVIPWMPGRAWEAYHEEKRAWMREYVRVAKKRIARIARKGYDLGPYIARPHLLELEAVYGSREENIDKLARMAEEQRAGTGEEQLVDVVDSVLNDVLKRVGWNV